jgi:uncharacterized protein (UPF0248 family)
MVYPREVFSRLKWTKGESLEEATIWYVHRGVPGDLMEIRGSAIKSLDRGFFETEDAMIPYHRIVRIDYRGGNIFLRPPRTPPRKAKSAGSPRKS